MAATSWFRKNQKKLLGILVVFLMVIWGIGPAAEYIVPKPAVGEILGEKITQEQFSNTAIRWGRIFFRDSEESLAKQAWKQMALFRQAEKMGIYITKDELAQEIQNWFPVDPRIFTDKEGYRRMLGSVFHLTETQFEETIKEYLLIRKLQYLLKNTVRVTRDEAFKRYIKENERVKVRYAAFKAEGFLSQVETGEDEIRSFYNKYRENIPDFEEGIWGYKEPEKVKIEYVMAGYDMAEKQVNITDEVMHNYYEDKKELMFRKENGDVPEGVKRIEGEDTDETSVSEYKPFDEVKEQIRNNLLFKEREAIVNRLIADADNEIYENIEEEGSLSFSGLAEKHGLMYVIPTNSKNGTNYFTKDELREVIIDLPQFPEQVFEREINDPSPPLDFLEGKFIFQVTEKIAPHIPSYEKIRDKVAGDLRFEKAFEAAEMYAEKCLEKINQTSFEEGIKAIEEETGKIEITGTNYISRPGIVIEDDDTEVLGEGKAGIADVAFGLEVGESAIVIEDKGEKTCYVITLVERKKVDPERFEEEKDSIMAQYLAEKQLAFFSEWESWITKKTQLGKSRG